MHSLAMKAPNGQKLGQISGGWIIIAHQSRGHLNGGGAGMGVVKHQFTPRIYLQYHDSMHLVED